jgi:hypothetical protein
MPTLKTTGDLGRLSEMVLPGGGPSDVQLLEYFLTCCEEAAFALVRLWEPAPGLPLGTVTRVREVLTAADFEKKRG